MGINPYQTQDCYMYRSWVKSLANHQSNMSQNRPMQSKKKLKVQQLMQLLKVGET